MHASKTQGAPSIVKETEEERADLRLATIGTKAKFRKRFASTEITRISVETSSLNAQTVRTLPPRGLSTSHSPSWGWRRPIKISCRQTCLRKERLRVSSWVETSFSLIAALSKTWIFFMNAAVWILWERVEKKLTMQERPCQTSQVKKHANSNLIMLRDNHRWYRIKACWKARNSPEPRKVNVMLKTLSSIKILNSRSM